MEARLSVLKPALSQTHDKEFKFSQDNHSRGEEEIGKAGDFKSLSGPGKKIKCDLKRWGWGEL